jgi:hypothetical protein
MAKLPLFGFLSRPVSVNFPQDLPDTCDVLALQVSEYRVPPADKGVFTYGIPEIAVTRAWPTSISPTWAASLAVPLNYNSSGSPENQAENDNYYGPGSGANAAVSMYGVSKITSAAVTRNFLWTQGPGCEVGNSGTNKTYEVRNYMFWNLSLIKQSYALTDLDFVIDFEGCSGSIFQVWAEVLKSASSVAYASLGSVTMTKAATMGFAYSSMAYWAKGIGQPTITTGETDALNPTVTLSVNVTASDYSMGMSGSGFGGNAENTFTVTSGAGSD